MIPKWPSSFPYYYIDGLQHPSTIATLQGHAGALYRMHSSGAPSIVQEHLQSLMDGILNRIWETSAGERNYGHRMAILQSCLEIADILTESSQDNRAERLFATIHIYHFLCELEDVKCTTRPYAMAYALYETLLAICGEGARRRLNDLKFADFMEPFAIEIVLDEHFHRPKDKYKQWIAEAVSKYEDELKIGPRFPHRYDDTKTAFDIYFDWDDITFPRFCHLMQMLVDAVFGRSINLGCDIRNDSADGHDIRSWCHIWDEAIHREISQYSPDCHVVLFDPHNFEEEGAIHDTDTGFVAILTSHQISRIETILARHGIGGAIDSAPATTPQSRHQ